MGKQSSRTLLYVIPSLDLGGAEHHLAEIAPRLAGRGWKVVICCLWHRGVQADAVAAGGVEVISPGSLGSDRPVRRLLRPLRLISAAIGLGVLMLRRRPAIAHFYLPLSYLVGGPVAILTRTPVRIMSRRSRNHYQRAHPLAARCELMLHARMSAVIANSRSVAGDLLAEGCGRETVGLIYNGVDLDRFRPIRNREEARRDQEIGADDFVMITVANLIAYKGHLDLIEALAGIRNRLPEGWLLLCVGRDDGCRSEIDRRAGELGIARHIRFLGSRRDVPELLGLADLGILASHEEGFSNAVLEMMAAGLASVVTDVGGNSEAIRADVSGLVVPAKSPSELGRAILTLAGDPATRDRMGETARLRAAEQFSLEACVESYARLYEALLAGEPIGRVAGPAMAKSSTEQE